MTPTEFNNHKEILIASRRNKATTFNAVATMLWDEILMQQYKFDRITEEAKVLEGLTKKDIQNYCKVVILSIFNFSLYANCTINCGIV